MTWFTLPPLSADQRAAFYDARAAAAWLDRQPQANAPAMLAEFLVQLRAFNGCAVPPDERLKALTVLRNALFSVSAGCQRRYENKPLPLPAAEQALSTSVSALWRAFGTAYLHCLRACLEGAPAISMHAAKVAHRALSCLRMEQMNAYLVHAEPDADFWRTLHATFVSAEVLGVARDPLEDRLLGETKESTINGQYAMAILMHLARPATLGRTQLAATARWLARWREQVRVLAEMDSNPKACCVALDLSLDSPLCENGGTPRLVRWLSVGGVLRKMAQRVELLATGESPENLKLGSSLSADACIDLLHRLGACFKAAPRRVPPLREDARTLRVAAGLDNIYRALGGTGLGSAQARAPSFGDRLSQEQLAVFGHVVRSEEPEGKTEAWRVLWELAEPDAADVDGALCLLRPAGVGDFRLALHNLLAVFLTTPGTQQPGSALAVITSLSTRGDGNLVAQLDGYPAEPFPVRLEMRERTTGSMQLLPAVMLPAAGPGEPASVFLPAGVPARAAAMRFVEPQQNATLVWRLDQCIERGGDYERWRLLAEPA